MKMKHIAGRMCALRPTPQEYERMAHKIAKSIANEWADDPWAVLLDGEKSDYIKAAQLALRSIGIIPFAHKDASPMGACVVRPEFIQAMRYEIEANTPRKGDWRLFKISNPALARAWLEEHTAKLCAAMYAKNRDAVREHAADVANIAMKIDECLGPKNTL